MTVLLNIFFNIISQHGGVLALLQVCSEKKGSSQQVELKDEGGAVGGGADRQFERSSFDFSSQRPK